MIWNIALLSARACFAVMIDLKWDGLTAGNIIRNIVLNIALHTKARVALYILGDLIKQRAACHTCGFKNRTAAGYSPDD